MTTTQRTRSSRSLSNTKRRLFFILTLLSPFLLLVLIEVVLRIGHYGPDLSLFTREVIAGKTYLLMNHDVKGRYFSRVDFSPNTSPDYFVVPKPPGTFRIFCLGGSTTVGFPYSYVGSFPTFLRDRLRRTFPEKSIEVINIGMTATNSYTVADLARELSGYEPDMLCVYDGHNEFYGSLGIGSHESISASRWVTKLYLRLIHYRTFMLLRDTYWGIGRMLTGAPVAEPPGTMMERLARGQYIRYGNPEYQQALAIFAANTGEVAERYKAANIPVLFCAQASNMRDRPPFVSEDSPSLTPEQRLTYHATFNAGIASLLEGKYADALRQLQSAADLDSLRGDVHFQMAVCLDSLGRKSDARAGYTRARDYDMLRFRASSDFNDVLRRMDDGRTVLFVDIERKFRANSTDSLIGSSLILEHLHPNARGYFLIAKEIASTMSLHQLLATQSEWNAMELDDEALWAHKPLTELDERCATRRTTILTSGWPFRPDTKPPPPVPADDTLMSIVERMVNGRMTWEEGHVEAARFYERRGDWNNVEKEYVAVVNQIPLNVSAYLLLGQLYLRQTRNVDAARILLASTKVEETLFANRALGMLALEAHDAIPFFEKALTLCVETQDMTEVGYLLAEAYHNNGDMKRAREHVQHVLQLSPAFAPARKLSRRLNDQVQ